MPDKDPAPAVAGSPRLILRAEGAAIALVGIVLYWRAGAPWWLFAVLILAPDLSLLGYLAGPKAGAAVYNAAHTLLGPIALALAGMVAELPTAVFVALIWLAHVGFDRLLGYGLKYGRSFGDTHLGRIGRTSAVEQS